MSDRVERVPHLTARAAELWPQLQSFAVTDDSVPRPFEHRLAQRNGWTDAHAVAVMDEYRRFLLLTQVAGHPVVPSIAIEETWCLHLTYTRSYWDSLCQDVFGRRLHHEPNTGKRHEVKERQRWYGETLRSYRTIFSAEPPDDIWPDPAARFRDVTKYSRVNTRTHLVMERPNPFFLVLGIGFVAGVVALALWQPLAAAIIVGAAVITFIKYRFDRRKAARARGPQTG